MNESERAIEAISPDEHGFAIRVSFERDGRCSVWFDAWHEDFDDVEQAVKCVRFGLSDRCRLLVQSRGGFDHKWTVQYLQDGEWIDESTMGLLIFPFWWRPHVRYLQNRVLHV